MDARSTIVVGYDGSNACELGLHRAVRMCAGLPLGMVHVACFVEESHRGVRLPSGEEMSQWAAVDFLRHSVIQLSKDWVQGAQEVRVGVHLQAGRYDAEEISRSLVDLSYRLHADQIVLGAQGLGGTTHGRIGRVAQGVLDYSDIPVHLEYAMSIRHHVPTNLIRWAYVFGGASLGAPQMSDENSNSKGA